MGERRSDARARSLLSGKIIFNHRSSTVDCVVRNLSSTGARIVLSDTIALPREFELTIPPKAVSYRAQIRWRTATEFGVQFIPFEGAQTESDQIAAKLRELEAEQAVLRARLSRLGSAV